VPLTASRLEDRLESLDDVTLTADHQAVPALEPPDATARSDVDVVNLPLSYHLHPPHVVLEEGVTPVDDRVARRHPLGQVGHDLLGSRAGRHHHPRDARRSDRTDEVVERGRAGSALAPDRLDAGRIRRVPDDLVAASNQAARHVGPHPTQPYHPELHAVLLDL